jgi:hypothetical protein
MIKFRENQKICFSLISINIHKKETTYADKVINLQM